MTERDVIEFFIRRHDDAVRAVNVAWHRSGRNLALKARAFRAEANQGDLVRRFAHNVDEIIFIGPSLRRGGRSQAGGYNESQQQPGFKAKINNHKPTLAQDDNPAKPIRTLLLESC